MFGVDVPTPSPGLALTRARGSRPPVARARLCGCVLITGLLGAPLVVGSELPDPTVEPAAGTTVDRTANAQALMDRAEGLREAGEIALAVRYARAALDLAPEASAIAERARTALYFDLPVLEIQRLITAGRAGDAEALARATLEENRDDPRRSAQLNLLLAQLAHVRSGDPFADDVDTHAVLEEIRGRMRRFHRRTGSYPASLRELDEVLPAGQGPLERFEVIHYRGGEQEYAMALVNRDDPQQTLTLQDTGLVR